MEGDDETTNVLNPRENSGITTLQQARVILEYKLLAT
jgi:hypothetical protein